jgi:hypothetical protein
MSNTPGFGAALGEFIGGLWNLGAQSLRDAEAWRDQANTERTRRANERASRKQQQEWLEEVRRQNSRGQAGFANEAEARAALNGKGGRPSNLDRRKF